MALKLMLRRIRLNLFEGGAGGAGAGAAAGGEGASAESAQGETNGIPSPTRKGNKGEFANVVFGKQDAAEGATATKDASAAGEQTTSERKSFDELIKGEYKDDFTKATQDIINRRFKETKQQQAKMNGMQEVIDILNTKYKTSDIAALKTAIESDSTMWEEAAEEAGMSVDQFKTLSKLQRENSVLQKQRAEAEQQQRANAQMAQWEQEAAQLKTMFPDFDLKAEVQNPAFIGLISNRAYPVSMEAAYRAIHGQELMQQAVTRTQQSTEAAVTANIRAKGMRPAENGSSAQSAFTVKDDVSKLTRKERAEIARRAAKGEIIRF